MKLAQNETGNLTESRVRQKLESLGLIVIKPVPDVGIDFKVFNPNNQNKFVRIQVKGRNPKLIKTYRWFQLRVPKRELEIAKSSGIKATETWRKKVLMVDFFILDAAHLMKCGYFLRSKHFSLYH